LSFDHKEYLFALFLLVPAALAMAIHWRRQGSFLNLFRGGSGPDLKQIRRRYLLSSLAFLAFCGCMAIALAGPRQGFVLAPDHRRGSDMVLALDLSRSMDARDGGGASRLERAAAIARELVAGEGGNVRWAVAIGKGSGVLAIPLTNDAETVLGFLEGISGAALTGQGTNLEDLLDAAIRAFKSGFPGKRWILLFSDGEALQGNFPAALERALAADIAIVSLGLGTEAGAPVPGQPVTSRLERALLENAARRSGGAYIDGMGDDAAKLVREKLRESGGPGNFRRESRPLAHLFILAGIAAFGFSRLAGKSRRPRRREKQ
jgi:Ca-activated chloride channel family protein